MEIQNYVCTLSQAKKLAEFGIVQSSLLWHYHSPVLGGDGWGCGTEGDMKIIGSVTEKYSAFIGPELLAMLPDVINMLSCSAWLQFSRNVSGLYCIAYWQKNDKGEKIHPIYFFHDQNMAVVCANALIDLLFTTVIEPHKINEQLQKFQG